jgi:tetratricopeptide (TPR) repeat protein
MYLFMGRYQDSIAALKRSIELRPNRDAYTNLGAAYFVLRRFAEAADSIQLSLKLDAADPLDWGTSGTLFTGLQVVEVRPIPHIKRQSRCFGRKSKSILGILKRLAILLFIMQWSGIKKEHTKVFKKL